ncbi:MAG: hypothetical protein HY710_04065 [Candidatus Latescibacteria bacterium]|nr:hypothetical protein [Candidatus Latescibacterota bacterium]
MRVRRCPSCKSREVYRSRHRWHERCLQWLHPGRRLFHCHTCGTHYWDIAELPVQYQSPADRRENTYGLSVPREAPDPPVRRDHIGLQCPSCGTWKTTVGRWWDDLWTWQSGRNKLYRCRRCGTVFAPPP